MLPLPTQPYEKSAKEQWYVVVLRNRRLTNVGIRRVMEIYTMRYLNLVCSNRLLSRYTMEWWSTRFMIHVGERVHIHFECGQFGSYGT